MRKRLERMAETKLRITEAAMRLHTTVGPANTTISAVAEEAGVSRVTVYRHFPEEEYLFMACSAHWAQLHPGPDPEAWKEIEGLEDRARQALAELYGWFRENHSDLHPIMRDFKAMPEAFQEAMTELMSEYGMALVAGTGIRGRRRERLRAVARHVTSFWTWRSLALEHGLSGDDTVDVAVGFVLSI